MINSFLDMNGYYFNQNKFEKAILAIGSTEYHGDHLPYGTDTLVAEHLAKQTAMHFDDLLLLPTIPIGMSQHYSSFSIAISLSTETLIKILYEIFDSLNKHKIRKLLIINGHDGNIPAIQAATKEYRTKNPEFKIIILEAWWETAAKLLPKDTFQAWGGLGHAGEGETSMMLYIKPELVNFDVAKGVIPNLPENIQYTWLFGEITPYGATGDPRKATEQKGEKMNKVLTKLLVDCVKEMDEKDWEI